MIKDPEEEAMFGGSINFSQEPYGKMQIWGSIWGVKAGSHPFHVHEFGDLREGCASTGMHWDPTGVMGTDQLPLGDLDNVIADKNGDANVEMRDTDLQLWGDDSIVGRALVIHHVLDKEGNGGGPRIGCCTIGLAASPKKEVYSQPRY